MGYVSLPEGSQIGFIETPIFGVKIPKKNGLSCHHLDLAKMPKATWRNSYAMNHDKPGLIDFQIFSPYGCFQR